MVLDDLLTEMVESVRLRLGDEGPRILIAMAANGIVVQASTDRLIQVFENLIDNAVSFSPPAGTIRINVSREGDWATVTVADEGPGVPAEHRDKIFSRFFSYRPEGVADLDHIGLGLAVVKAIVDAYGGVVAVTDNPDGGARFTVQLRAEG